MRLKSRVTVHLERATHLLSGLLLLLHAEYAGAVYVHEAIHIYGWLAEQYGE